jgi:hypothetical protein
VPHRNPDEEEIPCSVLEISDKIAHGTATTPDLLCAPSVHENVEQANL